MYRLEKFIFDIAKPVFRPGIRGGSLRILKNGQPLMQIGDDNGPAFVMAANGWRTILKIMKDPEFNLGETYINKEWDLLEGDLGQFVSWLAQNNRELMRRTPGPEELLNNPLTSKKNVAVHYDLGNDLYRSFLDEGMNYSCAFFENERMSLREAQINKIYTTISRAKVAPGMKVLDIGCGWGELCRTLAAGIPGAEVTGITLSEQQYAWAQGKNRGSENPANFLLRDYREHAAKNPDTYDRIISVGMFEHVGRFHYDQFFDCVQRMLRPGGRAVIHSIMTPETGASTSRWLDTYIFPGGCIPYLPDALESAESQGLTISKEPYIHGSSNYAETIRRWRANYNENRHTLDPAHYDERFHRIWNFYLATSQAAFNSLGYYVAQMVFSKS